MKKLAIVIVWAAIAAQTYVSASAGSNASEAIQNGINARMAQIDAQTR